MTTDALFPSRRAPEVHTCAKSSGSGVCVCVRRSVLKSRVKGRVPGIHQHLGAVALVFGEGGGMIAEYKAQDTHFP